jgi:hypothetical protein
MDGQNDTTSTNPYMALRAAKIARNQARLKELGLYKPDVSKGSAIASSRKRGSVTKQKKNHNVAAPTGSRRRSSRISGLTINPDYKESKDFKELTTPLYPDTRTRGTKRLLDVDEIHLDGADERMQVPSKPSSSPYKQTAPAAPATNSVRTISLDVSILLQKFLAKPMETFGKYFVIETSFHEAAYREDQQRLAGVSRLSFNKFSGVQPWKNVIFLWINLGGPGNSLANDFSHNGSRVAWFGGSKMREDSPVIQNLIRIGKESASKPSLTSGIILWCRQYNWETKKLPPYTCLGRLAYESHISGSQPVAFTWRLIDYEAMVADESTRTIFRGISGLE